MGGVPTGSIKPLLLAKAINITGKIELLLSCNCRAMIMGIRILAEAVFETSSVKKIVAKIKQIIIATNGKPKVASLRKSPSKFASPVSKSIFPKESPEPKSKSDGQSISLKFFGVSIFCFEKMGKTKSAIPAASAMIAGDKASSMKLDHSEERGMKSLIKLGAIQKNTVVKKINITCF